MRRSQTMRSEPPQQDRRPVDGQWLAEGIWQTPAAEKTPALVWFTTAYIVEHHRDVASEPLWGQWAVRPAPELDPAVNGGRIRSLLVPSRRGGNYKTRVLLQEDVESIIRRRTDAKERERPPGKVGKWLTADIYQDVEDLWFTDPFAVGKYGVSRETLSNWRAGGHVRWQDVPRLNRPKVGQAVLVVSAQKDLARIAHRAFER
jgi:hypothetical protein